MFLYKSGDAGIKMEWEDHLALDPRSECAHTARVARGERDRVSAAHRAAGCTTASRFSSSEASLKPPSAIARKSAVGV